MSDKKSNLKVLGKRIKIQREKLKMTQETLAERIGVARQTLTKWENDKGYPDLEMLVNMCDVFECETGYLLGEIDCETRELTDICSATGLTEQAVKKLKEYSENLKKSVPIENINNIVSLIICNLYFEEMIIKFCKIAQKRYEDEEYLPNIINKNENEMRELLKGMSLIIQCGLTVAPSFFNDDEQILGAKQAGMNMVDEIVEQIYEQIIEPAYPKSKAKKSLEFLIEAMHNIDLSTLEEEEHNG